MNVWIATIGEPLPIDGNNVRLLRSFQFAEWLSERGHTVNFITNSVDHYNRRQRVNVTKSFAMTEALVVTLLKVCAYKKAFSIQRYISHKQIIKSFTKWVNNSRPATPDIIVVAYPTFELVSVIQNFANAHKVPVIIDCRDAWPDIFEERIPSGFKFLWPKISSALDKKLSLELNRATAIFSHSSPFLEWAIRKANRKRNNYDTVFPFTYSSTTENTVYRQKYGVRNKVTRIVFAGSLTERINLDMICSSLENLGSFKIELLVAGAGEHSSVLRKLVNDKKLNVKFLGWLSQTKLSELFASADFGLVPYHGPDFKMSIPNKFVEYISFGLPILCLDETHMAKLVEAEGCGIVLQSSDLTSSWQRVKAVSENLERMNMLSNNSINLFNNRFQQDVVFSTIEEKLLDVIDRSENNA